VLADRRSPDRKVRGQLADRERPGAQPLDDAPAGRVAERVEHRIRRLVAHE
jgi:hypothetical protein